MVLHMCGKNYIDLYIHMKLLSLVLTLLALAPFVTGCSFAITPLIFLIDNNEAGGDMDAAYAISPSSIDDGDWYVSSEGKEPAKISSL